MRVVSYTAAGCVVFDASGVLVLLRPSRGEVRLPKGHVEDGEDPRDAALRETIEEAGYDDLEVVADLGEQLVEFDLPGPDARRMKRTELFFLARARSHRQIPRPFYDAHQFEPVWRSWDDAAAQMTYVAEREWLRRAREAAAQ